MGCPPIEEYRQVSTLATITDLLQRQELADGDLVRIMELIAATVQAAGAALYRRSYSDDDDDYTLDCQAAFAGKRDSAEMFPPSITAGALRENFWQRLNCPQISRYPLLVVGASTAWQDVLVCPLPFRGGMFGMLVLPGFPPASPHLEEVVQAFLHTLRNLFSLWVENWNCRKMFADVFHVFPNPSFIMTVDERIALWNRANEQLTGWSAESIVGKDNYTSSLPYYGTRRPMVANLIIRPDPEWQQTYAEFVEENDRINALAFCPALPSGGGYLRTNTQRLYDCTNRLWGAMHAVRDVTMERQLQENLERSESMYRVIADFAGVGILLLSGDEIIYANEQFFEFFGKSRSQLTLDSLREWVEIKEFGFIDTLIRQVLTDKAEPFRFEFQSLQAGEARYYNALAQLINYAGRDVVHFVIDDITRQKEIDRLARSNELKLFHEERLTALGTMAAGIAHELNQPLNTIRVISDGFLYCNEKGLGLDQFELRDNIEMISRQVMRMSSVIQNIRNFARDDVSPEFTDVLVNDAVENVFSMIGRQLEAHNITVEKKLAGNLPAVQAPVNRLEQVVTNLLINARQAFDSCQHHDWRIWISSELREGAVVLEVGDNATGIPEDIIKRIFYPFFTTKSVGKGTGLGLSISQSIVASMNGKLEVKNNERGGATFEVRIPV